MIILYLYGFASGPESNKAQFFKYKFSSFDVKFDIFDFIHDKTSFTNLKTSFLLEKLHSYIEMHYSSYNIVFIGSSFGAFLVNWYTNIHPENITKLVLIAPALDFSASSISNILTTSPSAWKEKQFTPVFHYRYNQEIPLAFSFYQDLLFNPPPTIDELKVIIPTLIFHGKFDDVCPISLSRRYANINPQVVLHELEGDHQLLDHKETMWKLIKEFINV